MRVLPATVFFLANVSESWSQEKWPIEFGIEDQALLSAPLMKQINRRKGRLREVDDRFGTRNRSTTGKTFAVTGGFPKIAEQALFPRPLSLV